MKYHHAAGEKTHSDKKHASHFNRNHIILITVVFGALSVYYLAFSWRTHQQTAANQAIVLAQSLEAMLHPEHISELSGSAADLGKPAYEMEKTDLMRLVQTTTQIRFAYILGYENDEIIVLIDSEAPESAYYSPPGQILAEAVSVYREPFRTGETILSAPLATRFGKGISAMVPVKDPAGGQVIAVLALVFSADEWQERLYVQMIPDLILVFSLLLFLIVFLYTLIQKNALRQLSKDLTYNEALYHNIFSQAPIGVALVKGHHFLKDSIHGYATINPMVETILGRTSAELGSITWPEITHSDDLQADLNLFDRFKGDEIEDYTMEKRFIKPDGSIVWTDIHVSRLRGLADNQDLHLLLIEDITSYKEGEQKLIESERSKSVLLSNLPGMAYRCKYDPDWTMQFVSDGCYELTGYAAQALLDNRDLSYNDMIKPEYRTILYQKWEEVIGQKNPFRHEYEITTATGETKWVLELGEGVYSETGDVEALEGLVLDISDRKTAEEKLRHTAEHDPWTGLYNRRYLEDLLVSDVGQPQTEKRAIIGINLNTMYLLSLSYGFGYSQTALKNVTEMLCSLCEEKRMLFSSYEYRFVFYIKGYSDKAELTAFCECIANTISPLLTAERIGGGIGVVEIGEENKDNVELLLRKLLLATEKSINEEDSELRVLIFDQETAAEIDREEKINRELVEIAKGIDSDRLFLQYQPILDLATNRICGFEALSRLQSRHFGLVPPNEFIPIAEKSKLIVPLGDQIIIKVLQFLKSLDTNGFTDTDVSINISANQLLRAEFSKNLIEKVRQWQINPARITLELTESIFASNYDEINQIIRGLRAIGIKTAIDDFGTGYSSLAREREIYANFLKIDKHFIDKLLESSPDTAITSDIIAMGHKLGHTVIAEGVENESQLQYLKKHGCDLVQGYLISKPLAETLTIQFISQYNDTINCLNQ